MRKFFAVCLVLLTSGLWPLIADAQAPQLINYQGRLLSGTNLVNGSVGLSLRLFNVASGGTAQYEDSNTVTVADGLYSTFIGDNTTAGSLVNALTNAAVYIEVAVNGTALSPRERLASVAYALSAQTAAGVVANGITAGMIATGAVSATALADGSVTAPKLATNAVTTSAIANGAVTAPKVAQATDYLPAISTTLATVPPVRTNNLGNSVAAVGTNWIVAGVYLANIGTNTSAGVAVIFDLSGNLVTTITNPAPVASDSFGYTVASVGTNRFLVGANRKTVGTNSEIGEAFLYDTSWTLLATITNPAPVTSSDFSQSMAGVGTNWFVIGAPLDSSSATDAGIAYLYDANGVLQHTITNPAPQAFSIFGAGISAVGSGRFIVGASGQTVGTNTIAGVSYLFNLNGTLVMTITNPAPVTYGYFGLSCAAVGNNRFAIGAVNDVVGTNTAGVVFIYDTNGVLVTTIPNPTPADSDQFGCAIAAIGSNRLVIAAYNDSTVAAAGGCAYLYDTAGNLLDILTDPAAAAGDKFGYSMAALPGGRFAVGSPGADAGAIDAGAVYLYSFGSHPDLIVSGVTPGGITPSMLGLRSVTAAAIADQAVTAAAIASNAVGAAQLAAGSVTTAAIANGAVGPTQLATDSVTTSAITNGAVTTAKLAAGAVQSANIAAGAVGNAALGASAVLSGNISSGAVQTVNIATGAVTAAKIADGQIVRSFNGLTDAVTLNAGSNMTFSTAGSTVTVSSAASGGLIWQVPPAGTNLAAQPNRGYVLTNTSQVLITLPLAPNVGDIVGISCLGSGGWKIAQNSNVTIRAVLLSGNTNPVHIFSKGWQDVASSADGAKIAAVTTGGFIYTSVDSGTNWTERATNHNWMAVASSSNGTKLVAAVYNGQLYTSTDSGTSWTARDSTRNWQSVASSSDGSKLVAAVDNGQLYTSIDSGANWTARESNRIWRAVASSADGTKLVACDQNEIGTYGNIYTSSNSGTNWAQSLFGDTWQSVAISSDGTKMVATAGGGLYASTNSGATWNNIQIWAASHVASSSDGTKLAALVTASGGLRINTSTDSGANWFLRESVRAWTSIASSSDGAKLVAVADDIYTSSDSGVTWHQPADAQAPYTTYILGQHDSSIQLQYMGGGLYMPISIVGTITSY